MTIKRCVFIILFSAIFTFASSAGINIKTPAWRKVGELGKEKNYIFVFCGDVKTKKGKKMMAVLEKTKKELSGRKKKSKKGKQKRISKKIAIVEVKMDDPKERELIGSFNIRENPTVLVVAPNGAATGYFPGTVDKNNLVESLVSLKEAELIKNLQDGCVVFLCFHGNKEPDFTAIKTDLKSVADNFKGTVNVVYANSDDKNEEKLRENFKMSSESETTVFIVIPPGRTAAKLEGDEINKANLMRTLLSSCGSGGCAPSSCK
ncbi:hypothetical protein KKF70_00915 [bacterium]|nr:hypothetical protein [bacterium]MBU3929290.1 hypothetical protein [bacterium]